MPKPCTHVYRTGEVGFGSKRNRDAKKKKNKEPEPASEEAGVVEEPKGRVKGGSEVTSQEDRNQTLQ